jgi:hypothetical protein
VNGSLAESRWRTLVDRIRRKQCTPFVGAGASAEVVPAAGVLARELASARNYPFADAGNLARVTQYIAVSDEERGPIKQQIIDRIDAAPPPDFDDPAQPHRLLADLRLPVYVTTNYDDYLAQAIRHYARARREPIEPREDIFPCDGTGPSVLGGRTSTLDDSDPIVYHLHGHKAQPDSIVLTESDYLDFLVRVVNQPNLLPARIREAMSPPNCLLFIGYSMEDWTFRVLFLSLLAAVSTARRVMHISVQLPPDDVAVERRGEVLNYFNEYYQDWWISVHWAEARDFCAELRRRLEDR